MSDPATSPPEGSDGSMETILASIRRIIREDDAATVPTPGPAAETDEDDLFLLEPSMMVQPIPPEEVAMTTGAGYAPNSAASSAADLAAALFDDPPPPAPPVMIEPPLPPAPVVLPPVPEAVQPRPTHALAGLPDEGLLAPQARLAAAQSLAALHEAVRPEPPLAPPVRLLRGGGPTLEDLVRDELRLQLKDWLDANLPALVERLVAREIERMTRPG